MVRDHLPGAAQDNLEQVLSFFPDIGSLVQQHDERAQNLFDECQSLHTALVASPGLLKIYQSIACEAPSTLGGDIGRHFGAYSTEEDFIAILAEYLVNNTVELPRHYATASLWNRYRDLLRTVLEDPQLAARQQGTGRAGAKLLESVDSLHSSLRERRSELSLRFDVPYVDKVVAVG